MLTSVAVALLLAVATGDYTGLGQGFYLPSLSLIEDNGFGERSPFIVIAGRWEIFFETQKVSESYRHTFL